VRDEELYALYSSPNIIAGDKIKKEMGGTCGTYAGRRGVYSCWWGDLMEGDHLKNLGVDGRIIIKGSSGSGMGGVWTGFLWLRIRSGVGLM
jgi:hypothetical protein